VPNGLGGDLVGSQVQQGWTRLAARRW
jgi:hypothetical protein